MLLSSFKNAEQHLGTIERANYFLLDLLRAYDKGPDKYKILSTAQSFSDRIYESSNEAPPYEVKVLNKLQIEKRERSLSIDEIKKLFKIIGSENTRENVLVGAYCY